MEPRRRTFYAVCGNSVEDSGDMDTSMLNWPWMPTEDIPEFELLLYALSPLTIDRTNLPTQRLLALIEAVPGYVSRQAIFPPSPERLINAILGLDFRGHQVVYDLMWEWRQNFKEFPISAEKSDILLRAIA